MQILRFFLGTAEIAYCGSPSSEYRWKFCQRSIISSIETAGKNEFCVFSYATKYLGIRYVAFLPSYHVSLMNSTLFLQMHMRASISHLNPIWSEKTNGFYPHVCIHMCATFTAKKGCVSHLLGLIMDISTSPTYFWYILFQTSTPSWTSINILTVSSTRSVLLQANQTHCGGHVIVKKIHRTFREL